MEKHDDPIPRNKKGETDIKKRNIKTVKVREAEKVRNYGIDRLNLAESVHEAENESMHKEYNASGNDSE